MDKPASKPARHQDQQQRASTDSSREAAMCRSPGQPEEAAMRAAQRALEEEEEARLASASLAAGDPTGWFDRLYAAGACGQVPVPWSRRQPHPLLVQWASARDLAGAGQRAIVVGCALGADAEYVAALGFDTTGFDISRHSHPACPPALPRFRRPVRCCRLARLPAGMVARLRPGHRDHHRPGPA